jgi:lysyl-tRNA synthetase class 1
MHWIDQIAEALLDRGRRHIIASGISISGHIHIGHCNDVFIADGIRRAVEQMGGEAEAIWYADDYDPMRRIPWPLNEGKLAERYKRYLGMPYINIPSPDQSHENFVDYFSRPFIDSLEDFGIKVKIYSGAEIYRSGKMAELIRAALERADEIREILNRYRAKPLPEDWLPYDAICEKCGRLATTKTYAWHDDRVSYKCEGCDYVAGCGHEGEADYTKGEGKLTWRVEWPARWRLLGVTCEPFGKDHAAAGGSYETGKAIAKRVFNYDAPYPVPYEWVSLKGIDEETGEIVHRRMSSSRGVVFTLPQWLSIAEPELLRYFIFRSKAMKSKEFDPGLPLLDFYDEYDMVENAYFTKMSIGDRKGEQVERIYELSQVGEVPKRQPQRISFRFAAVLCQVVKDWDRAIDLIKSKGMMIEPSQADIELAVQRLKRASNWIKDYAPEHLQFKIAETLPHEAEAIAAEQKKGLKILADDLSKKDYKPVELHNHVYEIAQNIGIEPQELFKAVYLALIGRESGPRVGNFISALDKEFVIKRFQEV